MERNKRKRFEEGNNETTTSSSKARLASSLATTSTTIMMGTATTRTTIDHDVTPQFQRFHLHLLKSLYETDDDDDDHDNGNGKSARDDDSSSSDSDSDDDCISKSTKTGGGGGGTVDKSLWAQTKKFLQEREQLIEQKKEAARLQGVHQEALNFMNEREYRSSGQASLSPSSKNEFGNNNGIVVPLASPSSSSGGFPAFTSTTSASPHSLSFFSPQRSVVALAPSQQQQLNDDDDDKKSPRSIQCFGLVTSLLERRFQSFDSAVRRRSDPYEPVLKEIEAKIRYLERKLQKLRDNSRSRHKQTLEDLLSRPVVLSSSLEASMMIPITKFPSGNGKGASSKLQTKLRLWKMLATDVREIVQQTDD